MRIGIDAKYLSRRRTGIGNTYGDWWSCFRKPPHSTSIFFIRTEESTQGLWKGGIAVNLILHFAGVLVRFGRLAGAPIWPGEIGSMFIGPATRFSPFECRAGS